MAHSCLSALELMRRGTWTRFDTQRWLEAIIYKEAGYLHASVPLGLATLPAPSGVDNDAPAPPTPATEAPCAHAGRCLGASKIYVASKVKRANYWKQLRSYGWCIISTWIDEAGEGQTVDVSELSKRCIDEIRNCDYLLLYAEADDDLCGALIEAGAALAFGKPVRCVATMHRFSVFDKHPSWKRFGSVAEALSTTTPPKGEA
jgi:hypothetical protein